jgi:undecaprenyl-diphosphatase
VLTVPLVVVMQAGTLGAVFVAAGLALVARRWRLARDLVASGTLAWLGAKAVKTFVKRGRPSMLLHGVVVRGAAATGLGFPSGHTAVAAALATAAAPYLGRRARRISWCGVGIVAITRIYVGAHFPLDTVGGAALGWVIGAALHLAWGGPGWPAHARAGARGAAARRDQSERNAVAAGRCPGVGPFPGRGQGRRAAVREGGGPRPAGRRLAVQDVAVFRLPGPG